MFPDHDTKIFDIEEQGKQLNALKEIFGANSTEIGKLSHTRYSRELSGIVEFIAEDPERHKPLISEKLRNGESINLDKLRGFEKLSDIFGTESPVYKYVSEKSEMHSQALALAKYVEQNSQTRAKHIETLVQNNARPQELDPGVLAAEESLKNNLNSNAQIKLQNMKERWIDSLDQRAAPAGTAPNAALDVIILSSNLLGADSRSPAYDYMRVVKVLGDFVQAEPAKNSSIIERVLSENMPTKEIDGNYLQSRSVVESTYGIDSSTTRQILSLPGDGTKHLDEVAWLIKHEPKTAPIIERVLNQEGPAQTKIGLERILSLKTLEDSFGIDAPQITKLLALEKAGLGLFNVANFLDEPLGSGPADDKPRTTSLGKGFLYVEMPKGYNSKANKDFLNNWQEPVKSKSDTYTLAHQNNEIGSATSQTPDATEKVENAAVPTDATTNAMMAKRMALVDRLLNENAKPRSFDLIRLNSLFELERHFAPDSKPMQAMLDFEQKEQLRLKDFARLLTKDDEHFSIARNAVDPELLVKVLEVSQNPNTFSRSTLSQVQDFLSATSNGSQKLDKLLRLAEDGQLSQITQFITMPQPRTEPINSIGSEKQNSTDSVTIHNSRQALVEKLINEDAPSWKLHSKRLLAFESLNHLFGETSETMQYLLKIEKDSLLRSLSTFIEKDPSERSALISRLASEQATVDKFDVSRLEALIKIEKLFPQGSPYYEKLYQQEANGAKLSDIATFLEQSHSKHLIVSSLGNKAEGEPDNATPKESSATLLLQNLLDSNATTDKFTFSYLTARTKLNAYFGTDSPTMSRIIELSEHGLSLSNLKEFIDEDVDTHKLMVQRLVDDGATVEALNASRLRGISILIQKLQPDQESFGHLLSLEKQGLNLGALAQYVSEDPHSRVPQVNSLLTQRASVAELNIKRLADATMMTKVSSYFAGDDNAIKYISQLQANDLSANRLMGFIEESPQSRIELVKKLISDGAGTDRFNQHMTLSLFPDDVAYKILDSSERDGTQTAQLIGALKNFKTGEQFYHTVTAWVRDGHPAVFPCC